MARSYSVLQFNQDRLKIVTGQHRGRVAEIRQTFEFTLPEGIRPSQENADPRALGAFLQTTFRDLGIRQQRVLLNIINNNILTRTHLFPPASSRDLYAMIRIHLTEEFPVNLEEYYIDYAILDRSGTELLVRMNVINRTLVRNVHASLRAARLKPVAFIPTPGSLGAVVRKASRINERPFDGAAPLALVDFQPGVANISFFQQGQMVFNRDVRLAGESTAEGTADAVVSTHTEQLRALGQRGMPFVPPSRFYLAGVLPDPMKVRDLLEDRLKLPVEVIRSLDSVRYPGGRPAEMLPDLDAAGLLLSVPRRNQKKSAYFDYFHLLRREQEKRSNRRALIAGPALAGLLLFGYFNYTYYSDLQAVRGRLERANQELGVLRASEQTRALALARDQLTAGREYRELLDQTLAYTAGHPQVFSGHLFALVERMPGEVALRSLNVNARGIHLDCEALSREAISQFELALKEVPFVSQVFISHIGVAEATGEGPGRFLFSVDCTLRGEAIP